MTTTMMTIMTTHNDDDDEAQYIDKEKCNVFNVNIVFFASLYSILIVSDNGSTFLFFVTVTGLKGYIGSAHTQLLEGC